MTVNTTIFDRLMWVAWYVQRVRDDLRARTNYISGSTSDSEEFTFLQGAHSVVVCRKHPCIKSRPVVACRLAFLYGADSHFPQIPAA